MGTARRRSVSAAWALDEVATAARALGRTARVQLKVDTGLGRNGLTPPDLARRIVERFLDTPFAGGRHQRRVDKISALDAERESHEHDAAH